MALLIENSVNIHGDEVPGGHLWFGVNENPRSKIRACAKNNKLWHAGAVLTAGQTVYPGKDIVWIRKTLRDMLEPEITQSPSRVIVLGPKWKNDPWSDVDEADNPSKWDRPVLLVISDQINGSQTAVSSCLGPWLAKHVQKRRNTIRFLLPAGDKQGLYADEELVYSVRCSFLCSREGWGADATYRALHQDFDRPLRQSLKNRFNRFALLRKWDFQQPQNCVFDTEKITEQGGGIPAAVEAKILLSLFDTTEFKTFVLNRAKDSDFVGSLMDDLTEPPPPNTGEVIPFLGETRVYELILDIAAEGEIALNVSGTWIGRRPEDVTKEDARRHLQKPFRTGQEMRQIQLGLPGAVGGGTDTAPNVPPPSGSQQGTGSTTAPGASPQPSGPGNEGSAYPQTHSETLTESDGRDNILGSPQPVFVPAIKTRKSEEPATGIN